jgi:hypothetical protein
VKGKKHACGSIVVARMRLESIQLEVPVQILRELEVAVIVKLKTVLVAAVLALRVKSYYSYLQNPRPFAF